MTMRWTRIPHALGTVVMLVGLCGCSTAIKHAYYEVRGANAKVVTMEDLDEPAIAQRLGAYQSVQFANATTTLSSRFCPESLLRQYDAFAAAETRKLSDLYAGREPALTITSDIQFYEPKGLLGSALMFTRININDGANTVIDALVVVKSKSFREGDDDDLAEATIRGIGKFLRKAKGDED